MNTTTNTVGPDQGPLTIAKLRGMMDKLAEVPPRPIFASSRLFPDDAARSWSEGRQDYVAAGPGFWTKASYALPATTPGQAFNLGAIPIRDIDHPANEWLREQVVTSLMRVMGGATTGVTPEFGVCFVG